LQARRKRRLLKESFYSSMQIVYDSIVLISLNRTNAKSGSCIQKNRGKIIRNL
jgi:hypothetical protein